MVSSASEGGLGAYVVDVGFVVVDVFATSLHVEDLAAFPSLSCFFDGGMFFVACLFAVWVGGLLGVRLAFTRCQGVFISESSFYLCRQAGGDDVMFAVLLPDAVKDAKEHADDQGNLEGTNPWFRLVVIMFACVVVVMVSIN